MSSVSSSPKLFGSRSASEPPSSGSVLGFGASGGRGAGDRPGGAPRPDSGAYVCAE